MKIKTSIVLDWFLVTSFCAIIFLTLDILPIIWNSLRSFMGDGVKYIPYIFISYSMLSLFLFAVVIKKKRNLITYVSFLVVSTILYIACTRIENPYEEMHLFEYFLLSLLVFRLLRHYIFTYRLYLISTIFTFIIALADEGLQLFVPQRTFSLADLAADFTAAALGQAAIAFIIMPKLELWRFKLKHTYRHFFAQEEFSSRKNNLKILTKHR